MAEVNEVRARSGTRQGHPETFTHTTMSTKAEVDTDKHGSVRTIKRTDGSQVETVYSKDENKRLESFTDIRPNKSKVTYQREGNNGAFRGTAFDSSGKKIADLGLVSNVDLRANSNLHFTNESGENIIVRGNGAVLATGKDHPEYGFDTEGRIDKITPPAHAIASGAHVRSYAYKGNTEELSEIKVEPRAKEPGQVYTHRFDEQKKAWEVRDSQGQVVTNDPSTQWQLDSKTRSLSANGVYRYDETHSSGLKVLHLSYPDGTEERLNMAQTADGGRTIFNYGDGGLPIGVQTIEADGTPGRKLLQTKTSDGLNHIREENPLKGSVVMWDEQKDGKWSGKVISGTVTDPNTDAIYKAGQALPDRQDMKLNTDVLVKTKDAQGKDVYKFNNKPILTFRDAQNNDHSQHRDGSDFILAPDKTYSLMNQKGQIVRSGPAKYNDIDRKYYPDQHNYVDFVWQAGTNGKEHLAQTNLVVDSKKSNIWSATESSEALIKPDGRFTTINDKEVTIVGRDLTVSKFARSTNDKGEVVLTPREITLPSGHKRVIEPSDDPQIPKRITDTFTDSKGNAVTRAIEALPKEEGRGPIQEQEYKLTETVAAKLPPQNFSDLSQPKTEAKVTAQAKLFDLEILSNFDIQATSSADPKTNYGKFEGTRWDLTAKQMDNIIPIPVEERYATAKERFVDLFAQAYLPDMKKDLLGKTINGQTITAETLKDKKSIAQLADNFRAGPLHLGRVEDSSIQPEANKDFMDSLNKRLATLKEQKVPEPEIEKTIKEAKANHISVMRQHGEAYRYELAYAIAKEVQLTAQRKAKEQQKAQPQKRETTTL